MPGPGGEPGRGVPGGGVPGPGGCVSGPGGTLLPGVVSQHALRQTLPLGETATAADSAHPTGMHSCWYMTVNGERHFQFILDDGSYSKFHAVNRFEV